MKKRIMTIVAVFVVACLSIWIGAATPEWIQYFERVVGEHSPYYTDVVNRPAKQIWGNFTSQHTVDGWHKSSIFPTPIPTVPFPTPAATVTPSDGDNYFLTEHSPTGIHTPFPTPAATVTPSAGDNYFLAQHSPTGLHTPFPTPAATVTPSDGDAYFLAEHTATGIHTPFPTPAVTVTPSAGDAYFLAEHTATGIHTPFPTPAATVTPSAGDNYFLTEHSPTGIHTPFPTPDPQTHVGTIGSALTLLNGWTSYGDPYGTAWIKRFGSSINGIVFLQGMLVPGTTTDGTILFVIPTGFRPAVTLVIGTLCGAAECKIVVNANGNAQIYSYVSGNVSLANVIYIQ